MSGSPQTNTINTIITRLSSSKFTDSSKFTSLAQVENALSAQRDHLKEITELRVKIYNDLNNNSNKFTNSGAAKDIIIKYLNFIDYIIALIKAKIAKDEAMTELLNKTFIGVNSFIKILSESKDKLTSKNTTNKILYNIGNVNDLKFNISNLELKDEEKPEGIKNTVDKDNIAQLVTKIIENCQTKLTKSIEGFTIQLGTIIEDKSKAGGNGNPNTSNIGSFKNLSNANLIVPDGSKLNKYQQSFMDIKNNYEKGLKDNIRAYREICETLLSDGTDQNPPGILKIIIDSVYRLNVVNKKITKKIGFNLDIFQNEPFAANKTAFEELKEEINAAKSGLSNTPVQQNLQGTQGIQGNQVKILTKVGETKKKGSQPITEGFQIFLDNLQRADENDLEPYRISLLESLQNIKTALDESIKKEDSAQTTGSPNSYIAKDFGWNDPIGDPNNPNTYKSGEWRETEIINDGSPPTGTIELRIKLLEQRTPDNDKIDKESLINITNDMIKLLQHEKSSAEKGRASQGTNNEGFRNTQKGFIPQLPPGASSSTSTGGGYKKKSKSKSKKMTSKKKSMKIAKKTSSKAKENKNKNKKIVKSYSKSKSKKQSGGFIRGGVLFPQDFYDTSTVM